ncbi:MAG: phosphotransferase [Pseudomonadota bacterium]
MDGIDLGAVERFLADSLPGFEGPVTAKKFASGQSNPTFLLTTPAEKYVLRRKPPGELLKSAHAVDREFRVQKALASTDVPVPRMHLLCEDEGVIGSAFYVMEFLPGRCFDDPRLPELSGEDRSTVYDELSRVLAAIHGVDYGACGLGDFGRPGNYVRRQLDRWKRQYRASETERIGAMEGLIVWLDESAPADDGLASLVHGDVRLDNLLFAEHEPSCVAVLDWELSTIGHPYADVAAVLMQWRMPAGMQGRGLKGVDRAALNIPSDEVFVASYCRRRGIEGIEHLEFYIAFCFFRMAAILQGVKKRGLDGNASNPVRAAELGAIVPLYAEEGLAAAQGS